MFRFIAGLLLVGLNDLSALPIGFRSHQIDLVYRQLQNENFRILHDQRTEGEARFLLQVAELAKPILDRWFYRQRRSPLLITTSAVTNNPSFANFITDGIELQTMGRGDRSLLLHEYVHMQMFLYLRNLFGSAGAIVNLPWLPAWWVEGLAEALSVSAGSDNHHGIERYQALTGNFLTYEQLHHLYGSDFSYRGYSVSGRFFTYILSQLRDPAMLKSLHEEFRFYSMPWFWPLTIVPLADTLPLDIVLKKQIGFSGRELYQKYIDESTKYWQRTRPEVLLGDQPGKRFTLQTLSNIHNVNGKLLTVSRFRDGVYTAEIAFSDKDSPFATELKKTTYGLADRRQLFFAPEQRQPRTYVNYYRHLQSGRTQARLVQVNDDKTTRVLQEGEFDTTDLFETANGRVIFLERQQSRTALCYYESLDKHCPLIAYYPQTLMVLGYQEEGTVWLRQQQEGVTSDSYRIITWHEDRGTKEFAWPYPRPLQVAFTSAEGSNEQVANFLIAEHRYRTIVITDMQMECRKKLKFADHLTAVFAQGSQLVLGLYDGGGHLLVQPSADNLVASEQGCDSFSYRSSPLLYTMRQGDKLASLPHVLTQYHQQTKPPQLEEQVELTVSSTPIKWQSRPLFVSPLVANEDALGWQIGLLSVPLIDSLQNETLVARFLYGINSKYPSIDLNLTSSRFWPRLSLTFFRHQSYNGVNDNDYASYYNEVGLRASLTTNWYLDQQRISLTLGVGSSHLSPYLNSDQMAQGMATNAIVAWRWDWRDYYRRLTLKGWTNVYPAIINNNFIYYRLGLAVDWLQTLTTSGIHLISGLEYSATFGEKPRNLQELYQSLQTHIAGSGGGINRIGIPLLSGGGLFTSRQGDSKTRLKGALVLPVIKNLDKIIWILYAEQLNFTAFCNYGGTWYRQDGWSTDDLIFAHGYNLDLLLNNKGINFNLGLGSGQVLRQTFELYATFGFDALF